MQKYCGFCGEKLDAEDRVCGQCGAPVPGKGNSGFGGRIDPATKRKIKKRIKVAAIILVALAIVAAAAVIVLNIIGPRGLVHKTMVAYEKYDIDSILENSSEVFYYSSYEDDAEDYFKMAIGEGLDYYENEVGHNCKYSYDINELFTLSERKYDATLSELEVMYPDYDTDLIQEIAVANLTVTAKRDKRSVEGELSITMTKEADGWKVLYIHNYYVY